MATQQTTQRTTRQTFLNACSKLPEHVTTVERLLSEREDTFHARLLAHLLTLQGQLNLIAIAHFSVASSDAFQQILSWTSFRDLDQSQQARMLDQLSLCEEALEECVGGRQTLSEELGSKEHVWKLPQEFCESIEPLHEILSSHLHCSHGHQHSARISFVSPCDQASTTLQCCLHFEQMAGSSVTSHMTFPSASSCGPILLEPIQEDEGGQSLCEIFDSSVRIRIKATSRSLLAEATTRPAALRCAELIPIASWLGSGRTGQEPLQDKRLMGEDRVMLALLISYAYLYLSGSDWWPHGQIEPKIWIHRSRRGFPQPYFAIPSNPTNYDSGSASSDIMEDDEFENYVNPKRPSLPRLGRLLLEIFVGRQITGYGEDFKLAKEQCRRATTGRYFLTVVEACLDKSKRFQDDGRLKNPTSKKKAFLDEIIQPLLRILCVNGSKVQDELGVRTRDSCACPEDFSSNKASRSHPTAPRETRLRECGPRPSLTRNNEGNEQALLLYAVSGTTGTTTVDKCAHATRILRTESKTRGADCLIGSTPSGTFGIKYVHRMINRAEKRKHTY